MLAVVRWGTFSLFVFLLGYACLVARISLDGERAMNRSDSEFDQGKVREALLFARRAAALYAPGLEHVRRADARLDAIAVGAESSQRREIAVLAWQAIRSTELQRSWGVGRPSDRAKRAERRLAALLADEGGRASLVDQQQFSKRVQLDFDAGSELRPARRLVPILALAAMLVATLLAYIGLGSEQSRRHWLWPAAGLFAVGAVAWAILLVLA